MKKLEIKLDNVNWQKSLFTVVLISVIAFAGIVAFLFVKPIEKNISKIIDEEISSTNITFDKKTLEMLRERQKPSEVSPASSRKNPFAPF